MTGSPLMSSATIAEQRRIATMSMDRVVAVWRSPDNAGGKTGALQAVPALARVIMEIFSPARGPQIALLAELGGGRASMLGLAPWDTAIQASDELRADGSVWKVEAVSYPYDMVICALSEMR